MALIKSAQTIFIVLATIKSTTSEALIGPDDEVVFNRTDLEADTFDWTEHPCIKNRQCEPDEPMNCSYVFVVEHFSTMSKACYDCPFNMADCFRPHCISAGGVQKAIYTVNRQIPGPLVEVCENDTVIVEVRNRLLAEGTTIHWHGFKQIGSPYMDGVPYVTQCPIMPGENFKYVFKATSIGTFFWHSHIGVQRADGLFGALIVKKIDNYKLTLSMYDKDDHRIIINDWMSMSGIANQMKMYYDRPSVTPDTILVNGLARYKAFTKYHKTLYTPTATFVVKKHSKHRFRLIDAGSEDCPIEMSIDNHTLHVISLDSNDIIPQTVDAITIWPGERVDFTVYANKKIGNYWIRFHGYGQCAANRVYQVAVLRYQGAPERDPTAPIGYDIPDAENMRVLNPYNKGTESKSRTNVNIPDLWSIEEDHDGLDGPVDSQIYIGFDFYDIDNFDFARKDLYDRSQIEMNKKYKNRWIGTLQFNHISMQMPPFPLLSQWQMIQPDMLCNAEKPPQNKNCTIESCLCPHVIHVGKDKLIEVVLVDEGGIVINHPLHLHGHFFRVIAEKHIDGPISIEDVKKLDENNEINRKLIGAPLKDTMKAPGNGYTIIRFRANNPGYWFFHCHFEQHANIGMALVFKVGEHEDLPPVPENFPQCGNYAPNEYEKTGKAFL